MKKYIQHTIVTIVFVMILSLQNKAQVCPDTITQISTNYYNPIKTQFDALLATNLLITSLGWAVLFRWLYKGFVRP
jgi:hypothetical protein